MSSKEEPPLAPHPCLSSLDFLGLGAGVHKPQHSQVWLPDWTPRCSRAQRDKSPLCNRRRDVPPKLRWKSSVVCAVYVRIAPDSFICLFRFPRGVSCNSSDWMTGISATAILQCKLPGICMLHSLPCYASCTSSVNPPASSPSYLPHCIHPMASPSLWASAWLSIIFFPSACFSRALLYILGFLLIFYLIPVSNHQQKQHLYASEFISSSTTRRP